MAFLASLAKEIGSINKIRYNIAMPTNQDATNYFKQFTKTQADAKKLGKLFKLSSRPTNQLNTFNAKKIGRNFIKIAAENKIMLKKKGLSDERMKKNITDKLTKKSELTEKTPEKTAKTEIIRQIREQSTPKAAIPAKTSANPLPPAPVKPMPMADKSNAIEAAVAHTQPAEPIAPDIG